MRILLIEADDIIADSLTSSLRDIRINVDRINMVEHGDALPWTHGMTPPYLAILLGDTQDEPAVVSTLRARNSSIPLLAMLNVRQTERIVQLLQAGADDCLIRPVKAQEIAARIHAVRRRGLEQQPVSVMIGPLTVFLDGRDPEVDGRPVKLSRREHSIFMALAERRGRVISKEGLFEAVYGLTGSQPFDKVIDVYICKLRRKLANATGGERFIETVIGRGYRLGWLGSDAEQTRAVA